MTQVPDVVSFDAMDGCEMVRAAGLVPYGPGHAPPPEEGVIVKQDPEGFSELAPGAPVVLMTQDSRGAAEGAPDPALAAEGM